MQEPTLTDVHIRSVDDAHKLFYAVQLGILSKIDKRLDAHERAALRPGNVYVWEEKGPTSDTFSVSMERFTEGKSWTASRVRDEFLMYFEDTKKTRGRGDAARAKSSENQVVRPGEHDQYIKLTYSVYRDDPDQFAQGSSSDDKAAQRKPRKWHLNAYFTKLTEGQLRTIDDIPALRDLQVPEGTFKSARATKGGKKGEPGKAGGSSVKRTFAPFPVNYRAPRLDLQPAPTHTPPPPLRPAPSPSHAQTPHLPADPMPIGILPLAMPPQPAPQQTFSSPETFSAGPSTLPSLHLSPPAHFPHTIAAYMPAPFPAEPPPDTAYAPPPPPHASPDMALSPSLSDYSSASWPSHSSGSGSGHSRVSASPALSHHSSAMDVFAPLTDHGTPYEPAPLHQLFGGAAGAGGGFGGGGGFGMGDISMGEELASQAGPVRVDLAPLNTLGRSHPYRRSPIDDRTLRLLGPVPR